MTGERGESPLRLKFGEGSFAFPGELAGRGITVAPRLPSLLTTPREIIERALDAPYDLPPLSRVVKGGDRVAVAVPDLTRYSALELYLPLMLKKMGEAGVREEDVALFVALGIHRRLTEDELYRMTGGLSSRLLTIQHDPDSNLTYLGRTSVGTPVSVNSELLTFDKIVATGTVCFHYFAGFGGGRKVIVPGLAGRDTCYATHFRVFSEKKGKHSRAVSGVLSGNPVHEDVTEAAGMVPVDFSLNTCVTPGKTLFAAFAGSLVASHEAACSFYAQYFRVTLEEKLPLVIASAGGYPKDINFIQSHKALDNAFQCVSDGGVIILLAECRDGFGHQDFFPWFRYENLEEFEDSLRRHYVVYGQTAYSVLSKAQRSHVILVSTLAPEEVRGMSMEPAADLDDALARARERVGAVDKFYLIPDAGYVLPHCAPATNDPPERGKAKTS